MEHCRRAVAAKAGDVVSCHQFALTTAVAASVADACCVMPPRRAELALLLQVMASEATLAMLAAIASERAVGVTLRNVIELAEDR